MAFDIGAVESRATSIASQTQRLGQAFVENTISDTRAILGDFTSCSRHLDAIRVRVTNRAVEYQTGVNRILVDLQVLPVTLIEEVWRQVAPRLVVPVDPHVYKLTRPREAVWRGEAPSFVEISPTDILPENRFAFFIIHGKDYPSDERAAFNNMYKPFETAARMFNNTVNNHWLNWADIYLVTYDSRLTDEARTIIRQGFESVIGDAVIGVAPMVTAAVLWRELERRAEETGRYLTNFIDNIPSDLLREKRCYIISHSLGSYVAAEALKQYANRYNNNPPPIAAWFCMAAALPANAFAASGNFREALHAVRLYDGESNGTQVMFSYLDAVLGTAYLFATNTNALGQSGALVPIKPVGNIDVTQLARESHLISQGYLDKIAPILRFLLATGRRERELPEHAIYINAENVGKCVSGNEFGKTHIDGSGILSAGCSTTGCQTDEEDLTGFIG